ncbi:uncharacterized protein LOC126035342 [Accipiter gentilis]|uniref:uncharacterized protein LOC126035342 n=1 Tax=Astur gentilis TaxID=8957 RepID=UPI00210FA097|nr:uncharacterized protein LOC126035342 [Accipiter gentilis]
MVPLMPPTQGAGDGQEGGTQKGDWRLVAKECCLSGVQFQPVVLPIRAAARGGYEWTPFDVKTVRELASTVQAHGVNSVQALTLFECLLSTPVAPFDVMQLMRGVLPPSLLLFKEKWRAQCLKIVTDAQAPGHHLVGVTIEQLMGEGQFATPQAQGMRGRDFAAVAPTALAAFKPVAAMDRADLPWVKICQGIAERFTAFLDRLQLAIQAANLPEMAKEVIVVECAKAQANLVVFECFFLQIAVILSWLVKPWVSATNFWQWMQGQLGSPMRVWMTSLSEPINACLYGIWLSGTELQSCLQPGIWMPQTIRLGFPFTTCVDYVCVCLRCSVWA